MKFNTKLNLKNLFLIVILFLVSVSLGLIFKVIGHKAAETSVASAQCWDVPGGNVEGASTGCECSEGGGGGGGGSGGSCESGSGSM